MHNWFLYGSTGAQEFRYTVCTGIEGCLCMMFPVSIAKLHTQLRLKTLKTSS